MDFLLKFLPSSSLLKLGGVLLIISSLGYFLWDWHYSVINDLNRAIAQKEQLLEKSKANLKEVLKENKLLESNLKTVGSELNICKLEMDAYDETDINFNPKDTEDENYFVY